ncbi:hypothetical protein [Bacteroides sp.]|uniref:hypothetical protein n=1 Tax=Bacteroides sp. TaxID=29523 RepID=UPI00261861F5|nr:hypothetical protein [Bacteroides sp.]MDD3036382.1 hypothetical protein [Bacteroides sp.]
MKKYLFMIALMASVFSFSACSDDDDEIDVKQLEGTWITTHDEGYSYDEEGKHPWNFDYDASNPTTDCEKIVISKISDNTYSVTSYYYYNKWNLDGTDEFTLEGNKLASEDYFDENITARLLSANSKQLIIEVKGKDEYGDIYNKKIYKRM